MQEYLGFGPGAHSDFGGRRFAYARDLNAYIKGGEHLSESACPAEREREEERVMLALRTARGLDLSALKEDTRDAILNVLAESRLGSMASPQLKSEVMREIGCSEGTYNRAYGELVKSGKVTKHIIRQRDGRNKWYSSLYCSETSDKVQI